MILWKNFKNLRGIQRIHISEPQKITNRLGFCNMSTTASRTPDYASCLTLRTQLRKPSPIRAIQPLLSLPGMISLGGGNPNPDTFPFETISMKLKTGETISLSPQETVDALQYSPTPGLPAFNQLLANLILSEHKPPVYIKNTDQFSLAVTNGSQDALSKAFELFVDSSTSILVGSPCYSGSLSFLEPLQGRIWSVETDSEGLIPESLERCLFESKSDPRFSPPRVLYTIPTGCNPTGVSYTEERQKKIYEIARRPENDLIILEDDPYFYLQFSSLKKPSFLSMDVDGRVLRFDSLSKVLSSGLRIGFVSGPKYLVDKINLHSQASTLHSSGISQSLALALLKKWNVHLLYNLNPSKPQVSDDFKKHIDHVCKIYKSRRDTFIKLCDNYLRGLAFWNVPTSGMFVWFHIPSVKDTKQLIETKAIEKKVILIPGSAFIPLNTTSSYVRASFSTASAQEMEEALKRLASLIREHQIENNS
eukprot:Sdes_comp18098_c0_seq1m7533